MTIHQLLLKYWGYSHFRPLQEEVISSILEGKDTLALMPTGGGKSICFQIPALAREGICIVISPLLALMKDQVERLKEKGIKAMSITSGMDKKEIDVAFDNCIYGNYKFLYLSPERLESELAVTRIKKMQVNLIAVDEAHCISQWGYDFRPSYLKISNLRQILINVPVLALTATATPEVASDIQQRLFFKKDNILRKSFERKNLAYIVIREEDKMRRLLNIVRKINGSGIVYARNRKRTQDVTDFLKANKVVADYYHAGLSNPNRDIRQDLWINNKIRVMVCTNAFGMGIDKSDVRFVVHLDLPDCPEAYFQEAGRAGRDEKKSYAILLYNDSDKLEAENNLTTKFPSLTEIRRTYQALANYFQIPIGYGYSNSFDFDLDSFSQKYTLNHLIVFNALKFLEKEGLLVLSDAIYRPSRIHFNLNKEQLYKFQVENIQYDLFIKLLLRSYSGVFDTYIKIAETDLAQRGNISLNEVKKILYKLQEHKVLSYLPQNEMPQITYTSERIDAKDIIISEDILKKRKAKARERLDAILYYASSKTKCRSRILLSYFGETDTYRCGVCDFCLERNKLNLSNLEFETAASQLKVFLMKEPAPLNQLVDAVKNSPVDKTLKVIQWLMDTEKIIYNAGNKLVWKV